MKSRNVTSFDLKKEKVKKIVQWKFQFRERKERERERRKRKRGGRQWERKDSREGEIDFLQKNLTHFLATTVEYGVSFLSPSI